MIITGTVRVITYSQYLKDKYGIKEVEFEDDNLTLDKKRAMALFDKMIEKRIDIAWSAPNGIALWTLDKELLLKMKKSGCYRLSLPIESGDQKMLSETIGKPLNLNMVKEIMKDIELYRFETCAFFIVGFPNETKEQLKNTFRFANQLRVDSLLFFYAMPYPGTRLYSIYKENNHPSGDFYCNSLRTREAIIYNRHLNAREIEKMIAWQVLKHKIYLLYRNPRAFYRTVVKRFFRTTPYFLYFIKKIIKALLNL